MKITLINPPYFEIEDDHVEQNLGIAYLAAVLIENGFKDTFILELTGISNMEDCLRKICASDIYGISCYTTSYKNVLQIIRYIKKEINPNAYIFIGGPHPSALPEETYRESGADLIVVGEGERAVLETAKQVEKGTPLKGIVRYKEIENLDEIPFPIRLLNCENPFSRTLHGEKTLSLLATRGCPNNCLHCNSNIMGSGSHGIRSRSVKNIIDEIRYLKELGIYSFRFNDDNFLAHPDIIELLKKIAIEKIRFRVFSHVEYLTDEVCNLLHNAGCDFVSVGIESLNPDNLRFLHKLNNLYNLNNLNYAIDNGLRIRASFMVGLPYDTDETIDLYFSQAALLPIQEFAVYPLIPYPGTGIAQNASKLHYKILNTDYELYMQMGKNRSAAYCLSYDNPHTGNKFGPDEVYAWKNRAEELLEKTMIHMRFSKVAN